jgi:hypothetical protein
MSANGFREEELITRNMNGQTRVFPVVGGRLRLAHEENETLSLQTEMVNWDGQYAVFRCCALTSKGEFVGYGTANHQRDARLSESLIELAETRSIARALRFAGYGMEFCGAEEVAHVMETEPVGERNQCKGTQKVSPRHDGKSKADTEAPHDATVRSNDGPRPEHHRNGLATQAQCRALYALTKKARYTEQDVEQLLGPLQVNSFQDLPRQEASRLISYLQTEVAA